MWIGNKPLGKIPQLVKRGGEGGVENVVEWNNPPTGRRFAKHEERKSRKNPSHSLVKDIRNEYQIPKATLHSTFAVVINFKRDFHSAFDVFVLVAINSEIYKLQVTTPPPPNEK